MTTGALTETITVRMGLAEGQREAAARLYLSAFHQQLAPILGDDNRTITMLARSFNTENVIIALNPSGHLLGLVGLANARGSFVDVKLNHMKDAYGLWNGALKLFSMSVVFHRGIKPDELLIDGLCVDDTMRRRGIGRRLLHAAVTYARDSHYRSVRLEIINNTEPHRLYTREGFVVTGVNRLPFGKRIFGVSHGITMVNTLK